jgi:hypothetical protein
MWSIPHAFGIDGTAASGRRVDFDSGCLLDYDFREIVYSFGRLLYFDSVLRWW